MKTKTVTFNAENWTGATFTVRYQILKDGTIKFKFRNEEFKILFTKEQDSSHTFIFGKCYDTHCSKYPIVKVSKLDFECWAATDDDCGGIFREHTDPVAATCQVLSNII
jgi:hypothetical protein